MRATSDAGLLSSSWFFDSCFFNYGWPFKKKCRFFRTISEFEDVNRNLPTHWFLSKIYYIKLDRVY